MRTPFPYQERAIARGVATNSYLALECGLGKTLCAIEIAKRLRVENTIPWFATLICLSPKAAVPQWIEAILDQDGGESDGVRVYVGDEAVYPILDVYNGTPVGRAMYVVMYYHQVVEHAKLLATVPWNLIVLDEAHYLNGRNSDRTIAVKTLTAYRTVAMSATPFDKSIVETWSVLNILYPQEFTSYWAFRNKYALLSSARDDGHKEILGTNTKTIGQIAPRLRQIMMYKSKASALPDLPPLIETYVYLLLEDKQRAFYNHIRDADDILIDMSEYWDASTYDGDDDEAALMLVNGILARIIRLQQAVVLPSILGAKNVPSVKMEWLQDYVNNNRSERMIIFTRFRAVAAFVADIFRCACVMSGRREKVEEFRARDPDVRLLVGTIAGMGTALNLGMASTAIFLDCDWSHINQYQAKQRIHRADITEPKHIIYLYARGTEDMRVKRILDAKGSESMLVSSYLSERTEEHV